MNKKLLLILGLTIIILSNVVAQEHNIVINNNYSAVFNTLNPLLNTSNPAATVYNPIDSISRFSIGYKHHSGDLKRSMDSHSANEYTLQTESYRKINKTLFFGRFEYLKSQNKDRKYSNLYNPYRGTPYIFVDTVHSNNYDQEEYTLAASVAQQINPILSLAGAVDYQIAMGAQDRDPRSLNKVSELGTKLGALVELQESRLGLDLHYTYFNEDIDINIIQEGATHTVFGLTGLGTTSRRNAKSFYRIYQGNDYGGSLQFETQNNIISFGVSTFEEVAKDGHQGSNATWSAIKTDSEYRGRKLSFSNIFTKQVGKNYHQLTLKAQQTKAVGSEYLQELVQTHEDYGVYQWQTISKDDKYAKTSYDAKLNYTFANYKESYLRDYSLSAEIAYYQQEEVYNFQDLRSDFSNLTYSISASKLFQTGQHSIEAMAQVSYKSNLENTQNLNFTTPITELITRPDFQYYTSDVMGGACSLVYSFSTQKDYHYYIKGKYDLYYSKDTFFDNKTRHYTSISLGLMF